jgi:hypothetical protein
LTVGAQWCDVVHIFFWLRWQRKYKKKEIVVDSNFETTIASFKKIIPLDYKSNTVLFNKIKNERC